MNPLKKKKNPGKNPGKGHPRARTLVEFKENFLDHFFCDNMQITSGPLWSDPCARLKIQISMHCLLPLHSLYFSESVELSIFLCSPVHSKGCSPEPGGQPTGQPVGQPTCRCCTIPRGGKWAWSVFPPFFSYVGLLSTATEVSKMPVTVMKD